MGQQDRDYWRDRYNKMTRHKSKDAHGPEFYLPYEGDPRLQKPAISLIGKLFLTIFVLLCAALAYRYLR